MSDSEIAVVECMSADELLLIDRAKDVGEALSAAYPGHLWMVGWAPGGTLIVKNGAISAHYGYTIDYAKICNHKQLVHAAVVAGGELLERAKMPRGAWNGRFAESLEGSDTKHFIPIPNI